jgi:hypothetical protein
MKKIINIVAALFILAAANNSVHAQSWNITGNAGTSSSTNFIGTTDNVSFKVRTKNLTRMTITNAGNVGIGTTAPAYKMDVRGGGINTDYDYYLEGYRVLSYGNGDNFFAGPNSGFSNGQGLFNSGCGGSALYSNIDGYSNTANGDAALYFNTHGNSNTATGSSALYSNTTGNNNTASGYQSMNLNASGSDNTATGWGTLFSNRTGYNNTATGEDALRQNIVGYNNTASGVDALYSDSTGVYNTASGSSSLYSNTTGGGNTADGHHALYHNTTANDNTASGSYALYNNTTGYSNAACGSNAIYSNSTGINNSALGKSAYFPIANLDNTSCIGFNSGGVVNASNRIEIGNASVGVIAGHVGFSTFSDARIKDNVKEDVPGLAFINKLRPVTYNLNIHRENEMVYKGTDKDKSDWKTKYDIEKIKMTGFLAQEVEKAAKEAGYDFSGVQRPANPDELYSLRYSDFVMPLVKSVQELDKTNVELKTEVSSLQTTINNQKSEIESIKSVLSSEQKQKLNDLTNSGKAILEQNSPNPFSSQTEIKFQLPAQFNSASLIINDENGKQIKTYNLQSPTPVIIKTGELSSGRYSYTLIVDGITVDSKQIILTK